MTRCRTLHFFPIITLELLLWSLLKYCLVKKIYLYHHYLCSSGFLNVFLCCWGDDLVHRNQYGKNCRRRYYSTPKFLLLLLLRLCLLKVAPPMLLLHRWSQERSCTSWREILAIEVLQWKVPSLFYVSTLEFNRGSSRFFKFLASISQNLLARSTYNFTVTRRRYCIVWC